MSTAVELGRLDWARVTLRIGDAAYSRAHLWGDGTTYHAETMNGEPLGTMVVATNSEGYQTVQRLDAKTYEMTDADGTVWHVSRAGCGCS